MRAFSSGAVALSGVEAVSNGVPAFKKPESRNASSTLIWMAVILGSCFFGLSVLASHLKPVPQEDGRRSCPSWAAPSSAAAASCTTCSSSPPSPSSSWRPTPPTPTSPASARSSPATASCPASCRTGATGSCSPTAIIALAALAGLLIIVFGGDTSALIPLYAVGVFTGFTLSQTGMVVHHWRLREPRWKVGLAINVVGAITSFIVLIVVVVSKFTIGAWIPVVVIPLFVLILSSIGRHYRKVHDAVARARRLEAAALPAQRRAPREQRQPGRAGGRELRPVAGPRPPRRGLGRGRRRGAGGAPATRGPGSDSPSSCTPSTRPTGS